MARSTKEILDILKEDVKKDSQFSNITDNKSSSFYNLLWMFSKVVNSYEQILEEHKKYVSTIVRGQRIGQRQWWIEKIKQYQTAGALNYLGEYDPVDESKRIIKYCTVYTDPNDNFLTVKVRGENAKIPSQYISSIESYVDKIKVIGTSIKVISQDADQIKLNGLQISYNSFIHSDVAELQKEVVSNIENMLATTSFGKTLYVQDIYDAVRQIQGINSVDIELDKIEVKAYNTVYRPLLSQSYIPVSGFLKLDNTSTYEFTNI